MADLKTLCIDGECRNVPSVEPATATPQMDGTGTVGSSVKYAREDHKHPTDTTRAPLASPALTGTPTAPTNGTASTSNTQIATPAFVQNAINRRIPKSMNCYEGGQIVEISNNTDRTILFSNWSAPSKGLVIATIGGYWSSNATGYRYLQVVVDGTGLVSYHRVPASPSSTTNMTVPFVAQIQSGAKISAKLRQTSGGALDFNNLTLRGIFIAD